MLGIRQSVPSKFDLALSMPLGCQKIYINIAQQIVRRIKERLFEGRLRNKPTVLDDTVP